MSSRWRRFEVLLPVQFNDGRPVPEDWLAEAVLEIVDHFGADGLKPALRTILPRNFLPAVSSIRIVSRQI